METNDENDGDVGLDQITQNDDGSTTYMLARPVNSEGSRLETITVRRPTPADLMAADNAKGGATARNIALIARLGNLPESTVKRLDGYDYLRLNNIASDFLVTRPASGGS